MPFRCLALSKPASLRLAGNQMASEFHLKGIAEQGALGIIFDQSLGLNFLPRVTHQIIPSRCGAGEFAR